MADEDADKDEDVLSAMDGEDEEESSLSESEDDDIISSIRPSKKVIYSSESEASEDKPSDGGSTFTYSFLKPSFGARFAKLIRNFSDIFLTLQLGYGYVLDAVAFAAQAILPIDKHSFVAWSVCLSHSCTLLKPFDRFRCHLAGTLVGSSDTFIVLDEVPGATFSKLS